MNTYLTSRILASLSLAAAAGLGACYAEHRHTTYRSDDGSAYATEDVVYTREAPVAPPLVHETITISPGPEYVWVAGHHEWRHGHWEWEPGRWERPGRANAVWMPAHWDHERNGWVWRRGHWE